MLFLYLVARARHIFKILAGFIGANLDRPKSSQLKGSDLKSFSLPSLLFIAFGAWKMIYLCWGGMELFPSFFHRNKKKKKLLFWQVFQAWSSFLLVGTFDFLDFRVARSTFSFKVMGICFEKFFRTSVFTHISRL